MVTTLQDFRRAVVSQIDRDLAAEDAHAAQLRAEVLPRLRESVALARAAGRCGRVWLFGSYAWGQPTGASDIDLLVEGAGDRFDLAADVGLRTGRMVHIIGFESAPPSLVARAIADGVPL